MVKNPRSSAGVNGYILMHAMWQSHLGTLHTWQPPRCSHNVTNAILMPAVRLPGSKDPLLVGPRGHTQSSLCSHRLCDLCLPLIIHPTRDSRTGSEEEAQDTPRLVTRYPTATGHDIHPAPPRVNPQRQLMAHSVLTFSPTYALCLKEF